MSDRIVFDDRYIKNDYFRMHSEEEYIKVEIELILFFKKVEVRSFTNMKFIVDKIARKYPQSNPYQIEIMANKIAMSNLD